VTKRVFAGAFALGFSFLFGNVAFAAPTEGPGEYMFHEYNDHGPQILYVFDKDGKMLGPVKDKSGDLAWALGNPNSGGGTALDTQLVEANVVKNKDGSYTLKSFKMTYQKLDAKGGPVGAAHEVDVTGVKLKSVHGGEDTETDYETKNGKSISDQTNNLSFGTKAKKALSIPADAPVPGSAAAPAGNEDKSGSSDAKSSNEYMFHEFDENGPHVLYVYDKDGNLLGPVKDKGGDLSWALGNPNAMGPDNNASGTTALDNRLVKADLEKNSDGSYTLKSFTLGVQKVDDSGKPVGSMKEVEITSVRLASVHGGEDTATYYKTADGDTYSDQGYALQFGTPAPKPLAVPADATSPSVMDKIRARSAEESHADPSIGMSGVLDERMKEKDKGAEDHGR
jgi:hypothetical protein